MQGTSEKKTEAKLEVVSCLTELHKFLLLEVALVPQIPPNGLNGAFQAALDQ